MRKNTAISHNFKLLSLAVAFSTIFISQNSVALHSSVTNYIEPFEITHANNFKNIIFNNASIAGKNIVVNGKIVDTSSVLSLNLRADSFRDPVQSFEFARKQINFANENGVELLIIDIPDITLNNLNRVSDILSSYNGHVILNFSLYTEHMESIPHMEGITYNDRTTNFKDNILVPKSTGGWVFVPRFPVLGERLLDSHRKSVDTLLTNINNSNLSSKVIGINPTFLHEGNWEVAPWGVFNRVVSTYHQQSPTLHANPSAYYLIDRHIDEDFIQGKWYFQNNIEIPRPTPEQLTVTSFSNMLNMNDDFSVNQEAFYYKIYKSDQVASMINMVGKHIKERTDNNLLVATNYGLINKFETTSGSNHLSIQKLINSDYIDIFNSSMSNNLNQGRRVDTGVVTDLVIASLSDIDHKLVILNDDTRPHWETDAISMINSYDVFINKLKFNQSIALQNNALYSLSDIKNKGWYTTLGDVDLFNNNLILSLRDEHNLIKENIKDVKTSNKVVMIVDELGFATLPYQGIGGPNARFVSQHLSSNLVSKMMMSGVPSIQYRMNDIINNPSLLDNAELVFFQNSTVVSNELLDLVNKLKNNNRTLVFMNYTGILNDNLFVNYDKIKNLTGFDLILESSDRSAGNFRYYPHFNDILVDNKNVLSSNSIDSKPDIISKDFGNWKSVYVLTPNIDEDSILSILREAGISQYSQDALMVENKNLLSIFTTNSNPDFYLPYPSIVKTLDGQLICESCLNFSLTKNEASYETFIINRLDDNFVTLPRGLFTDENRNSAYYGFGNQSFCSFANKRHMARSGFNEVAFLNSPKTTVSSYHLDQGLCDNHEENDLKRLPNGLFRQGQTIYFSEGNTSYCLMENSNLVFHYGFNELDVLKSPQIISLNDYNFLGVCTKKESGNSLVVELTPGLFRVDAQPFKAVSNTEFCIIKDVEHMKSLGYTASDYANAIQVDPELEFVSLGDCEQK